MGSGASALQAELDSATTEQITTALAALSPTEVEKVKAAVGMTADAAAAGAADEAAFWEAMCAHKGPYEEQDFGPAPDYSKAETWFHYGEDGTTGAEQAVDGLEKPPAAERPADCFYIHETTYYGDLWNQPLSETGPDNTTIYYLATGSSVFNASCRMYVPRFRQVTLAGMMHAAEGRKGLDTAYADVKSAFEHYLKERNDGRPLVIASHSQGSLYCMRLLQDCVEGKPLLKQVVAVYAIAAWVPLGMFEGEKAVFKDVKICKAADSVGCVISYTCECPDTVGTHRSKKENPDKEQEDWYPLPGHKVGEEWRLATAQPIVGTNPLTWSSNGMGPSEPEAWQGMLQLFKDNVTSDEGPVKDMDSLMGLMMGSGAGLKVNSLAKVEPTELQSIMEAVKIDEKTGDLQVGPLPAEMAGSSDQSFEHLNFLLFYFNVRDNLRTRLKALQGA